MCHGRSTDAARWHCNAVFIDGYSRVKPYSLHLYWTFQYVLEELGSVVAHKTAYMVVVVLHFAIAGQFLQCSGVNNSSVCYAPLIMDDLSYHMCKMYY
jgi:hypothetical protein